MLGIRWQHRDCGMADDRVRFARLDQLARCVWHVTQVRSSVRRKGRPRNRLIRQSAVCGADAPGNSTVGHAEKGTDSAHGCSFTAAFLPIFRYNRAVEQRTPRPRKLLIRSQPRLWTLDGGPSSDRSTAGNRRGFHEQGSAATGRGWVALRPACVGLLILSVDPRGGAGPRHHPRTARGESPGRSEAGCRPSGRTRTCPAGEPLRRRPIRTDDAQTAGRLLRRSASRGDWFGARDALFDEGIDLRTNLSQFYQGVTSGGLRQTFPYGLKFDYFGTIEVEKLVGWEGLFVNLHGESRFGQSVNRDVGSLVPANFALEFPKPTGSASALTNMQIEQFLGP